MALVWTKTGNPADQNIGFGSASATFTAVPIGTASSDRIVVVVVSQDQASGGGATSVSIAGTNSTKAVEESAFTSSLWYLNVAAGTTADIIVTFPFNLGKIGIAVGILTGSAAIPAATASNAHNNNGNPENVGPLTISAGGIAIVGGFALTDTASTLSNGTLDYCTTSGSFGFQVILGNNQTAGSQTVGFNIGAEFAGNSEVMASWDAAAAAASNIIGIAAAEW